MKRGFTVKIKVPKRTGHHAHRSGAGIHADRRTKRNRTRANKNRKDIDEQYRTR